MRRGISLPANLNLLGSNSNTTTSRTSSPTSSPKPARSSARFATTITHEKRALSSSSPAPWDLEEESGPPPLLDKIPEYGVHTIDDTATALEGYPLSPPLDSRREHYMITPDKSKRSLANLIVTPPLLPARSISFGFESTVAALKKQFSSSFQPKPLPHRAMSTGALGTSSSSLDGAAAAATTPTTSTTPTTLWNRAKTPEKMSLDDAASITTTDVDLSHHIMLKALDYGTLPGIIQSIALLESSSLFDEMKSALCFNSSDYCPAKADFARAICEAFDMCNTDQAKHRVIEILECWLITHRNLDMMKLFGSGYAPELREFLYHLRRDDASDGENPERNRGNSWWSDSQHRRGSLWSSQDGGGGGNSTSTARRNSAWSSVHATQSDVENPQGRLSVFEDSKFRRVWAEDMLNRWDTTEKWDMEDSSRPHARSNVTTPTVTPILSSVATGNVAVVGGGSASDRTTPVPSSLILQNAVHGSGWLPSSPSQRAQQQPPSTPRHQRRDTRHHRSQSAPPQLQSCPIPQSRDLDLMLAYTAAAKSPLDDDYGPPPFETQHHETGSRPSSPTQNNVVLSRGQQVSSTSTSATPTTPPLHRRGSSFTLDSWRRSSASSFSSLFTVPSGESGGGGGGGGGDEKPTFPISLTRLNPARVARLLMHVMCDEAYFHITADAMRSMKARRRDTYVLRMIRFFEVLSYWPASEIFSGASRSVSDRIDAFSFFVTLAQDLRTLGNYHAAFAVVSGLFRPQLGWVCDLCHRRDKQPLARLKRLVSSDANYRVYRADLTKREIPNAPYIPFLGIVTRDLVAWEEAPSFTQPGVINFAKSRRLWVTIREFLEGQKGIVVTTSHGGEMETTLDGDVKAWLTFSMSRTVLDMGVLTDLSSQCKANYTKRISERAFHAARKVGHQIDGKLAQF